MPEPKPQGRREPPRSLAAEISLLRELLKQVRENLDAADTLKESLAVADSLGKLCARIAGLLRAEQTLADSQAGPYNASHVLAKLVEKVKKEEEERNAGQKPD